MVIVITEDDVNEAKAHIVIHIMTYEENILDVQRIIFHSLSKLGRHLHGVRSVIQIIEDRLKSQIFVSKQAMIDFVNQMNISVE
ncbi:hypothetical protein COT95_01725 [Candidatus Falkowbacteria bacterium CG10_big_fil_rev_8_21_14_0_10_37_6]|jgi:hypothetical protein|uniref:Uncharacterized protein n=1 Tax=Candidatus Falkowbacteria bacterium CG10_big_fil_rev_8_21_14_0_10_37_6 TaxID=1974563 RepID=A0A2H0V726_9BACT|nr:MAG: hypothetical protein COT95_01725 [Candidatus Falkowbacteria bacterium CG10_big_fil_rev_8_21_14_0_10_37_6]